MKTTRVQKEKHAKSRIEDVAVESAKAAKAKAVKDDLDGLLAEIDAVLEANAVEGLTEEYALKYEQTGGE